MERQNRYELRPRSFGEILDGAFQLYRDNFKTFFLISCVLLPPSAALAALQADMIRAITVAPPQTWSALSGLYQRHVGSLILLVMIILILAIVESAALMAAISNAYLGQKVTVAGSFKRALSYAGPLMAGAFFVWLGTALGLMLCLIPGVIFALNRILYVPAIIVEGKSSTEAFDRSKFLVAGQRQRIGLMVFLIGIIQALIGSGLSVAIPHSVSEIPVLGPVLLQLPQVLISPLYPAVQALFYFDGRVRKEAFDLEVLSRETFGDAPATVGPAA